MNLKLLFYILFLLDTEYLPAQQILKSYIQEGLQHNIGIQSKQIALDKSLLALKEARSYFLPAVDFSTQYTLAAGGRAIELPLGDLLNGVYASLNQLTNSESFPQLSNTREQFLPNNFYDAKFRVTYAVWNKDRQYNKEINETSRQLASQDLEIYQAELIHQIKLAYYQYGMSLKAVEIYTAAQELINRNIQDTEVFIKNGVALPAQLLRARSEAASIQSKLSTASHQVENARYYFNFLLNKDLGSEIIFEEPELPKNLLFEEPESTKPKRTELEKLETALRIQEQVIAWKKQFYSPKINLFADLGSQAFNFQVNKNSLYAMGGLQLEMPIFQGGRNKIQAQQATLDMRTIQFQKDLVEDQILLGSKKAYNDWMSARAAYQANVELHKAAESYFGLIEKGYKDGRHTMIEYLDARNQLTQSALQQMLSYYQIKMAQISYDYAIGNNTY